jgi:plastocyanin
VTGPGNTQTTSFAAPAAAGDYLFWCDVHTTTMKGILHVE